MSRLVVLAPRGVEVDEASDRRADVTTRGWRYRREIPARLEQHRLGLAIPAKRDQGGAEQALCRADAPVVFRKDAPAIRYQLGRQDPDPQAIPQQRLGGVGLL